LYLGAAGAGLSGEDDSAVIKVYQQLTGIELPKARRKKKRSSKRA
jgi:hypothetical protein